MQRKTSLLAALLIIAIGAVLIIANKSIASTGIVIAAGIIFLLAGIVNLVFFSSRGSLYDSRGQRVQSRRSGTSTAFSVISGVAAVVLGLCMLIFQEVFASLIPFIFGCIIAIGAIVQVYYLAIGVRPLSLSPWLYLVPALLIVASIYIFMCQTPVDDSMIMLISGISLALFGVASLVEAILVGIAARRASTHAPTPTPQQSQIVELPEEN